jgi:hypothetical protein
LTKQQAFYSVHIIELTRILFVTAQNTLRSYASAAVGISGVTRLSLSPLENESSDAVEETDIIESRFETGVAVRGDRLLEVDDLDPFFRLWLCGDSVAFVVPPSGVELRDKPREC